MTTEELIEWLEEEQGFAVADKNNADESRDSGDLWYFKGKLEMINDILEKLRE